MLFLFYMGENKSSEKKRELSKKAQPDKGKDGDLKIEIFGAGVVAQQ